MSQGTTDDAKKDSANAATFDSEEEGVFSIVLWGDLDDQFSIPDLLSKSSDDNDEERWNYVPSEEELSSEMGDTDDGEMERTYLLVMTCSLTSLLNCPQIL